MSKQHQLKQAFQYIMNAIIQNASYQQRDIIGEDEQLSEIGSQCIMINLDQQSESYDLFASDPGYESHWINMLIHHLNEAYPQFPIQKRQSTLTKQFVQYLIEVEQKPNEQTRSPEVIITIDNIKLRKIVLYSKTRKFSFLLISFQPINTQCYMVIVRNFHGQILELSFHSSDEPKYETLLNCTLLFQFPFVIMFDMIDDMNSSHIEDTLKQRFTHLSQRVPLAYFTIKSKNSQSTFSAMKGFGFDLTCNTLFSQENNIKRPGLSISQTQKIKIQQSLIEYYESLVKEEAKNLSTINLEPRELLRGILKINYGRKIQTSNYQRDQVKLEDFIKSQFQIFIAVQMKSNHESSKEEHQKQPRRIKANCLPCRKHLNIDQPASSICNACSNISRNDFFFCDKCFDSYHKSGSLLNNPSRKKDYVSGKSKPQTSNPHGPNVNEKAKEHQSQYLQNQKIRIKRQAQIFDENSSQLSEIQKLYLIKLQQSALKLIKLTGGLRNADLFYVSKYPEATSQKQYQAEIKNQFQFQKFIDKTSLCQVKMFQNQVFLKMNALRQSQITLKTVKQSQNLQSKLSPSQENRKQQQMDIEESHSIQYESSEY